MTFVFINDVSVNVFPDITFTGYLPDDVRNMGCSPHDPDQTAMREKGRHDSSASDSIGRADLLLLTAYFKLNTNFSM
jgi:hypothetical protein